MQQLDDIIASHQHQQGPLLPILHEVQVAYGYISEEAIRAIAAGLNLSRAEVHGVVSFYHDFKAAPEPYPVVKLCRAEACQARGVAALDQVVADATGVAIETVYCLGLCAVGPAAMLAGGEVHARLTLESFAALLQSEVAR
ncbi:NAD(P)H-dependent oxidoreductase subunit E [Aquisediminimonas sediminicola]|uniref:NAD(P)H-dependent oxidoreductase subunit E n=1 Tax=Alteraquisediminimonas sediminicola TaxID=2676787 RepID=UPI001C8D2062|nr:NAD(P)H-dependent oxidoreductase subunit E [Aquisediminimonas sediminicola]